MEQKNKNSGLTLVKSFNTQRTIEINQISLPQAFITLKIWAKVYQNVLFIIPIL